MEQQTKQLPIDQLHFDLENPRYGVLGKTVSTESQALELIVSTFLVDDLLSSISVNGFFEGEPLIVKPRKTGGYTVIEGNRRLASLLILTGDARAKGQSRRRDIYVAKMKKRGKSLPEKYGAIVVGDGAQARERVLAYLGTKHIVGPSQWDSYAKAKWMAEIKEVSDLSLEQIKDMIGDVGGLVDKMLEGYYLSEQVRKSGKFEGSQSYVRGRGSNPDFPFSWVYTAIGFAGMRAFLGISDKKEPQPDLVSSKKLENAGAVFEMMFGNRHEKKEPVIKESRNLAALSKALTDPAKSARLRNGVPLATVEEESRPTAERLSVLISEVLENYTKANGILGERSFDIDEIEAIEDPAKRAAVAAKTFRNGIRQLLTAKEDEDDE